MTRVLTIGIASFLLIGSTEYYISFLNGLNVKPSERRDEHSQSEFKLKITATFACRPNAFSENPVGLSVFFEGREIKSWQETVARQSIEFDRFEAIKLGKNELTISCYPDLDQDLSSSGFGLSPQADSAKQPPIAEAIHIELWQDQHLVAEKTRWVSSSQPVIISLPFTIQHSPSDHQH